MENKTQVRNLAHGNTANPLNDLVPGRSMAPPAFALKASKDSFIRHKIGRNGINDPADLQKLGQHLVNAGIPATIVQQLGDPEKLGTFIEKYQAEVLGWRNTDGCIDPGGKTLEAMLQMKGKDVVLGWFKPKAQKPKVKAPKQKNNALDDNAPLLSDSQYFSQYDKGAQAVPLSFLKQNMGAKNSEKAYRNVACFQTCRYMLLQAGFDPGSRADAEYLLNMESSGSGKTFKKQVSGKSENFASSISELDESLQRGIPVVAGVNKNTKQFSWTNTKADGKVSPTDHFIVIVGRKVLDDGRIAYRFYDPARYSASNGTSASNLLIQDANGQFTGNAYGDHIYNLAEVRPNF